MITGIGIDILEIARLQRTIDTAGRHFLEKIFTPSEIAYCEAKAHPAQHFAARFAAKEALSKALATGWSGTFRWKDVEVVNDPSGRPRLIPHGPLGDALGDATVHVSLSHSDSQVVAVVVLEGHPA
jgi:holo-[acyl-carrier protein] synthase